MAYNATEINGQALENILSALEQMAAGGTSLRLPISERRDGIDAICYGINVLVGELTFLKDEAEKSNQLKSSFLANISHEIRTPVAVIHGFSEMLKRPDLSPSDVSDAINRISSNARDLLRLINDILDLAKAEAGTLRVVKQCMTVEKLFSEVISNFKEQASAKGLILKLNLLFDRDEVIETDILRTRQVLSNIVGNAIKFTDKGHVEIDVVVTEGLFLKIDIKDTGIGIDSKYCDQLFQPFSQVDQTPMIHNGAGLGLAFSKRIARLLGGDIFLADTKIGVGSHFTFMIPIVNNSDSMMTSEVQGPLNLSKEVEPLKNIRLLLIEDNEDLQHLVSTLLEMEGAAVDIACDGIEGIDKALTGRYQVILMDVRMPKMNGIQAAKKLRSSGFKTPILGLTGYATDEHLAECLDAGYNDCVTKPFDEKLLISKIQSLARQSGRE